MMASKIDRRFYFILFFSHLSDHFQNGLDAAKSTKQMIAMYYN